MGATILRLSNTMNKPFTVLLDDGRITMRGITNGKCGSLESSNLNKGFCTRKEAKVIERIIVAHACAGVDVESEAYREGLMTVIESLANAA